MSLPVGILAGGVATRLRPITETIPKSLVDIAGTPFVVRQLDYLRRQGISRVVLCVGHFGEQVEEVVGDGSAFGIDVKYSWDGPRLLGTGGALKRALPLLGDQFFVLYGDSYLPIDFRAVEAEYFGRGKPALISVLRNNDRWDRSNVAFHDGVVTEYNKREPGSGMDHIDYGLGVLAASTLANVPTDQPFDLADVYHDLSLRGLLAGHEVFDRFYEIGSHAGLEDTVNYFQHSKGP